MSDPNYIAAVVFHWNWRVTSGEPAPPGGLGQNAVAWLPRKFPQADGSERFWEERLADRQYAGVDAAILHTHKGFIPQLQNNLRVLARAAYPIALFMEPASYEGGFKMPTLTAANAEAVLWEMLSTWVTRVLREYPLEGWMTHNGDPVVYWWTMPGHQNVPDSVFVNLRQRFHAVYGAWPAFSVHRQFSQVTIGSGCFEKNRMFGGTARDPLENLRGYYHPSYPDNVWMVPGFLQAKTGANYIPRQGGVPFGQALERAVAEAPRVQRVYLPENEYTEGTMYLGVMGPMAHAPGDGHRDWLSVPKDERLSTTVHPARVDLPGTGLVPLNDRWSDSDNPRHYLDALHEWAPRMHAAWEEQPPPPPPVRPTEYPNGDTAPQVAYGPINPSVAEVDEYLHTFIRLHGFGGVLVRLEGRPVSAGVHRFCEQADRDGYLVVLRMYGEEAEGTAPADLLADLPHAERVVQELAQYQNWVLEPGHDLPEWTTPAEVDEWTRALRQIRPALMVLPRVEHLGNQAALVPIPDGTWYEEAGALCHALHVLGVDTFLAALDWIEEEAQRLGFSLAALTDGFRDRPQGAPKDKSEEEQAAMLALAQGRVMCYWGNFDDTEDRVPVPYGNLNAIREANGLPPLAEEEEMAHRLRHERWSTLDGNEAGDGGYTEEVEQYPEQVEYFQVELNTPPEGAEFEVVATDQQNQAGAWAHFKPLVPMRSYESQVSGLIVAIAPGRVLAGAHALRLRGRWISNVTVLARCVLQQGRNA